jgi:hypothetical protein
MKYVLTSIENQIKATFEAMKFKFNYDKIERNSIEFNEIFEYFLKSWEGGMVILCNFLNRQCFNDPNLKSLYIPKFPEIQFLLKKYGNVIKAYLLDSFFEFGVDINKGVSFEIFSKWILKDHDLEIVYSQKRLKIAVSLTCCKEIGLLIQ